MANNEIKPVDRHLQGQPVVIDQALDDHARATENEPFDFRLILATIRVNLLLIIGILGAALAIAVVVSLLMTPRYTAVTTVQINDQTAQVLGKAAGEDINQAQVASLQDTDRFLQTQTEVLNSRAMATRVAQRLNLIGNPAFYTAMARRMPQQSSTRREVEEDCLKTLLDAENGTLPRNSRLASISFKAADPVFAAKVANTWAAEFIQSNLQRRFDSSAYAREFIEGQLNEAKAKWENSERHLNTYARAAGLIRTRDAALPSGAGDGAETTSSPNSITAATMLQLNFAANQAEQQRVTAEQRYRAVAGTNLMNAPEVLGNPSMQSLMSDLSRAQAAYQSERTRHFDEYPSVLQAKAQVDTINQQIQTLTRTLRASVKQQYDAAVSNENELKSKVGSLKNQTLTEQDRSVQYNLLSREADSNRSLYENLLNRYKELTAAAGMSASNISIVDSADAPILPSSPNFLLNLAIGLVAGITIAVIVVLARHQLDDTVHLPEDVEAKLALPLLGIVPKSGENDPIDQLTDPKSSISEAYNSVRSSLLFSTPRGLPRTMMVTSSQASEGKSTTSVAIARGIAKLGRTVVLIDLDMRRPSIHAIFGVENRHGVSTLLSSQDEIEAAIRPTTYDNLSIISSGPIPPSPTDLLSSVNMPTLLAALAERFDVVILDCPPVLGLADAPVIASMVEGVVLVVEANRGRRGSLRSSVRRLQANRAHMLGGVLTMYDPKRGANRYSEYYGYSYYAYEHKDV